MTKASDVRFGRRGGREVPAGTRPGEALAELEEIRQAAIADGTWPGEPPDDGQLDLFG